MEAYSFIPRTDPWGNGVSEQLDLFAPASLPVILKGCVSFSTSHVDGQAVCWAHRWDYLKDGCGLRSGPIERAGPFPDWKACEAAFGPATSDAAVRKMIKQHGLAVQL